MAINAAPQNDIDRMLDVLEQQLCQTIVWVEAIQAISATWNQNADMRHDRFLVNTVYDALWDALITKTWAMWDDDRQKTISLPALAQHFRSDRGAEAVSFVRMVYDHSRDGDAHLNTIKLWRDKFVAHRTQPQHLRDPKNGSVMDDAEFDQNYKIHVSAIKNELQYIEKLLGTARKLRGEKPTYFGIVEEDAARDAKSAMDQWSKGAEAVSREALAAAMRLLHTGDPTA